MKKNAKYRFRLYVAGHGPNSLQAVVNLETLCRKFLPGRHEIEVIDMMQNPDRALADGIVLTPTLVKLAPRPKRTIVGNLSDTPTVLQAFGPN
jgi:circadian clock protein KaiB